MAYLGASTCRSARPTRGRIGSNKASTLSHLLPGSVLISPELSSFQSQGPQWKLLTKCEAAPTICRTVRHRAAPCLMERSKRARKKSPRVSVTLSREESTRLDALASHSKLARSWLGRYAIRRLLDAYNAGQLELPLPSEVVERRS